MHRLKPTRAETRSNTQDCIPDTDGIFLGLTSRDAVLYWLLHCICRIDGSVHMGSRGYRELPLLPHRWPSRGYVHPDGETLWTKPVKRIWWSSLLKSFRPTSAIIRLSQPIFRRSSGTCTRPSAKRHSASVSRSAKNCARQLRSRNQ